MKPVRILFISHIATRTGAPIQLCNLLYHLDPSGLWEKRVLIRQQSETSELEKEFAQACVTYLMQGEVIIPSRFSPEVMGDEYATFADFLECWNPDLVYSNTVTNGALVKLAHELKIPVIIHVQEMKPAFQKYTTGFLEETLSSAHFVCVSQAVRDYLARDYGIPEERLSLVHNSVDTKKIDRLLNKTRKDIRAELGIPGQATAIGGAGWMSLHKGVDLWLQVARRVAVELPEVDSYFLWVGYNQDSYAAQMSRDVGMLGLEGRVIFTGAVSNPYPYINAMDVFVMSSRHESIGLVSIEAAYLGKPVVCFGCSGGAREVVGTEAGAIVECLDSYEMAKEVIKLITNESLRRQQGAYAKRRVLRHFEIKDKAKDVQVIIEKVLALN